MTINAELLNKLMLLNPVKLSVGDVVTVNSFIYIDSELNTSVCPWVVEVSSETLGEYVYLSLYSH